MSHHMILGSRLHVPPSRTAGPKPAFQSSRSSRSRAGLCLTAHRFSGFPAMPQSSSRSRCVLPAMPQTRRPLAKAPTTPKPVTVQPPTTPKPVTAKPPTTPSNPTVQPPTTPSNPATQYVAELTKDFFKSWDNDFAAQSLPTQQQEDQLPRVTTLLKLYSTAHKDAANTPEGQHLVDVINAYNKRIIAGPVPRSAFTATMPGHVDAKFDL